MEIKISKEKKDKIKKFIEEGRYKDFDAFFEHAAYLLIMAEEGKDQMMKDGIVFIGKNVELNSRRKDYN